MPQRARELRSLGVLVAGAAALRSVELAEHQGFDSAWLTLPRTAEQAAERTADRPSAQLDTLAAAAARTHRLALGTTTLPLTGASAPQLAEELAALDRSHGARLNPGVEFGTVGTGPGTIGATSGTVGTGANGATPGTVGAGPVAVGTDRRQVRELLDGLREFAPALARRLWCAPDDRHTARWAGAQELNLLVDAAGSAEQRLALIRAFRESHPRGAWARVCQRLVVLPVDAATPTQRARYQEHAQRTPALVGLSAQLAELLTSDVAFREVEEAAFVLPDGFAPEDHAQLLADLASRLAPLLGWHPVY
ncbi:hypothetical protein C7C46_27300 [Streptomyces tateyamensis]|uniref:Luciferase-like domain-containing protein n=1 Tax=Streptomyces tateyamensis TaxID=565073 RepID=A0A2V4NZE0_9ACTN|nr:LLM class flavin-dependent oxidoreductase [Streptomyces tateyamensis]PYC70617.1 hypothetical protein C7C46_27300 [Streptomyces tateyamensis]